MTSKCTCGSCGKTFESQRSNSTTCYGCALDRLIGNGAPEEGDINSALITSGEMSDSNARQLQADLESIDHSGEEEWRRRIAGWYEEEDHRWDYLNERGEDE